jgi:hypothetical protein
MLDRKNRRERSGIRLRRGFRSGGLRPPRILVCAVRGQAFVGARHAVPGADTWLLAARAAAVSPRRGVALPCPVRRPQESATSAMSGRAAALHIALMAGATMPISQIRAQDLAGSARVKLLLRISKRLLTCPFVQQRLAVLPYRHNPLKLLRHRASVDWKFVVRCLRRNRCNGDRV